MARRTAATAAVKIDQAQRARQVMQLRMAGASERTIASQLGLSPGGVHKIIVRELATVRAETGEAAEEARKLELERLDQLQAALWPDAIGIDAQTGTRKAPNLQATDRVLRVMERRAALLDDAVDDLRHLDGRPGADDAAEPAPVVRMRGRVAQSIRESERQRVRAHRHVDHPLTSDAARVAGSTAARQPV